MRTFSVLRKSSFPSWPCCFFSKYFYPNPWWCFQLNFVRDDTHITYMKIAQFSRLLTPCPSTSKRRPISNESFPSPNDNEEIKIKHDPRKSIIFYQQSNYRIIYHLHTMLEKLLLRKFWKIIKKASLVAFLLKNLSCPIHAPVTIPKTDSTAGNTCRKHSFVPRIFKIAGKASVVEVFFSK